MRFDGYIYCLSNKSMPGILKIGETRRPIEERLSEANRRDTFKPPTEYVIEFAKKVHNSVEKENKIHEILKEARVNPKREFFHVKTDEVKKLFDLVDGEYYSDKTTKSYCEEDYYNNDESEFLMFKNWLKINTYKYSKGKVSLKKLSLATDLDENTVKQYMKKLGHIYYNFRFPSDESGNYDQGGYKYIELLYFSEKIK
jgi:hypothetical protein